MSIKAMTHVWANSRQKGSALVLLLAIADYAHDDGGGAYPSVETLAAKCRMTGRNVQHQIRALCEAGELCVEAGTGPHGANMYRLPMGENFSPLKTFQGEAGFTGGVKNSALPGEKQRTGGVKPASPNPSENRQYKPSVEPSSPPEAKPTNETPSRPATPAASPQTARGCRLRDDFAPSDENKAWAEAKYPGLDLAEVTDEFCDYWRGLPGRAALKVDWQITWRNRVRDKAERAARFAPKGNAPGRYVSAADAKLARQNAPSAFGHLMPPDEPEPPPPPDASRRSMAVLGSYRA